jgi:hypothetical protein
MATEPAYGEPWLRSLIVELKRQHYDRHVTFAAWRPDPADCGAERALADTMDHALRPSGIVTTPRYEEPDCPAGSSAFSAQSLLLGATPNVTEPVDTYCAKPR